MHLRIFSGCRKDDELKGNQTAFVGSSESWQSASGRGSGNRRMKLNSTMLWDTQSRILELWVRDTGAEGKGRVKDVPEFLALG